MLGLRHDFVDFKFMEATVVPRCLGNYLVCADPVHQIVEPSARRPNSPSIRNRGLELGTTRTDQPGLFACGVPGGDQRLPAAWRLHWFRRMGRRLFPDGSFEMKIEGPQPSWCQS